jgi:predicted DNA-binding transcriptional regulator AlpA
MVCDVKASNTSRTIPATHRQQASVAHIHEDCRKPVLLCAKEASQLLGLSVSGFARLRLPKVKFGRRAVRYQWSDIEALITRRIVHSRNFTGKSGVRKEVNGEYLLS